MAGAPIDAQTRSAVKARTGRQQRAWALVCATLLVPALLTGGDAIPSVITLLLSVIVVLQVRASVTLSRGVVAPARLVEPPQRWIDVTLPLEQHLPMWVARVEVSQGAERTVRRFLLFSDEALAVHDGSAAAIVEPGNGFNWIPVTTTSPQAATMHAAAQAAVLPEPMAPMHADVTDPSQATPAGAAGGRCRACGNRLRMVDRHCDGCGAAVSAEQRAALEAHLQRERTARLATSRKLGSDVNSAANAIAALAVLFVIGGVFMFFILRSQASDALGKLDQLPGDQVTYVQGEAVPVAELRAEIVRAPRRVLVVNLVLAAIMAGLFFCARSTPLPAVITALAVFIMVHLVNALIDPLTLVQGIPIKIFAIITLSAGIRAALQQRAQRAPG